MLVLDNTDSFIGIEYLEFISEFDYTEYEIVNVSGNYSTVGAEKELYMVTYKKIT